MTAIYNLFPNPPKAETADGTNYLHARIVSRGTVDTRLISQRIEDATSFTRGDVVGVLRCLSVQVARYLSEGYHVNLEGIGILSASLKCRPVERPRDIRSASVAFSDVNFRPCGELMDVLRSARLARSPFSHPSVELTDAQNRCLIQGYLATHPCISRSEFSCITGYTKARAVKTLNRMVANEILKRYGRGKGVVYFLNDPIKKQI